MKRDKKKMIAQNSIDSAALEEFYNRSYKNASMRTIAQKANMTVGNIYCYYKSKEDLYNHLVKDSYRTLISMLNRGKDFALDNKKISEAPLQNIIVDVSEELALRRKNYLALLLSNAGTDYHNVKENVQNLIENNYEAVVSHYEIEVGLKLGKERVFIIHMLAIGFYNSLVDIIQEYETKEDILNSLTAMIRLSFVGLEGFFK